MRKFPVNSSITTEERLVSVKAVSVMMVAGMARRKLNLYCSQMILLGLYGLCSGDKRSYEFVEAYHVVLSNVRVWFLDVAGIC